jgi:hypothetical protein
MPIERGRMCFFSYAGCVRQHHVIGGCMAVELFVKQRQRILTAALMYRVAVTCMVFSASA